MHPELMVFQHQLILGEGKYQGQFQKSIKDSIGFQMLQHYFRSSQMMQTGYIQKLIHNWFNIHASNCTGFNKYMPGQTSFDQPN